MTVAANQRWCSQIWVVAEIIAEITTEVAAEVAAEVATEVINRTELKPDCGSGDP